MGLKVELKVLIDESIIPAICDKQFTIIAVSITCFKNCKSSYTKVHHQFLLVLMKIAKCSKL